ncbi:hypothetical protein GOBAR_AA08707 [Gossypium barbadense]|uniref:Disease resistance protein At4g27190-like leucine-rich repeats domain-containing protein n=1 Tax=Gossypium barbadense TaxID=3634 RepID=A0A2P5Y8P0_GOSBA|nr:hypothetical protein GOBAR_AA08707 [Gossypium barbadense]
MIFHNELQPGSFCQLEEMVVEDCDELLAIFSSTMVGVFNYLQEHVDRQGQGIRSFQNLRKLRVSRCESLKNLFPASIAKHLQQLEDLSIRSCGVEEIVSEGEGVGEQPVRFEFPKVSSLLVENLKKLKCFYKGQHTIVWPMLKELSTDCSALLMIVGLEDVRIQETKGKGEAVLLVEEVPKVFPKLQQLELRDISDVDQFPPDLFHHVKVFKVEGGYHGGSFSIFSFLRRSYNLESLEIFSFNFEDVIVYKEDIGTLSPIKNLKLDSSINLKHIWRKDSEFGHIIYNLQTLRVWFCDDFLNIGASSVSFRNLTTLEVSYCKMMINVVTPSVVENLVQLTAMRSLTSFCSGSYTFNFPCLENVVVAMCPKLKIFSEGVLSTPQLQRVIKQETYYQNEYWTGDLNTTIQQLCTKKAVIPNLKRLTLSSIGIHMIWHHPSSSSLTHLYRLRVEGCHNLKYLFPSFLLKDLVLLRFLEIKDCNMMEQVIFTDGLGAEDHWRNYTILLESLSLKDLPKLKDICFENYLEFPWLRDLTLKNCPLLKTFISKSVSGDEPPIHQPTQTNDSAVLNEKVVFPRLEELLIQDCESLEEIIELQGLIANESQSTSATLSIVPETVTTKFVFPHVTHLGLGKLPRLKSFFSRMHTTQWPSLKQMEVIECPKARIFGEVQISNQQPLFCVNEDTFPVLEGLTLKTSDMIKGICDGQLSLQCFPNLKLLNLQFFPQTSTTLPYCFIRSLPKLQKLVINNASISELVQSEGLSHKGGHTSAFPQLKELSLSELPELTLKTFEPSLLSLKNLTTLEVSICQAFINLMACSTSKSLTLLERLSIADCELLEEIISCEGEDLQGSIVFPKLKYLKLSHLPSLASFSLAHHSLEFPVLQMVIVTECPKMKNFCQGELITPRLEQMHLTRDEDGELQWEGDLNTTIKHMFDEMNMQNSQAVEVTDQLLQME